jgi:Pvc16 N-terminal domain/IPT/TIG domain
VTSPLGIATVTAVLKDLLNDGLANSNLAASVGSVTVSALPPDRIGTGAEEPSRLNVFLYQITGNQGWRNEGFPSRDGAGTRVSHPPLALDLHYLVTAYGAADLDAEILLGYAAQVLHETSVLTRNLIRKTFSVASPVTDKLLPASVTDRNPADLADQVEMCKIVPRYLTAEDLSRLWSAMQARYRPSIAYDVSVVLIEVTTPSKAALPVRVPIVRVEPMKLPSIEYVEPAIALDGDTVMIIGSGLKGPSTTKVRISGALVAPPSGGVSDTAIGVTLPTGLLAGLHPLQVVHEVDLGEPPVPHAGAGFESNVAAFVVAPQITTATPITVAAGSTLVVDVSPPVASDQRLSVLIGEQALVVPRRPANGPPTSTSVEVDIPDDFSTGTFLLRVQVDGAVSALDVDDDENSATFQQYIGPMIEVT